MADLVQIERGMEQRYVAQQSMTQRNHPDTCDRAPCMTAVSTVSSESRVRVFILDMRIWVPTSRTKQKAAQNLHGRGTSSQ